jgi:hypothetical protein
MSLPLALKALLGDLARLSPQHRISEYDKLEDLVKNLKSVPPAKVGVQNPLILLDSHFGGNDKKRNLEDSSYIGHQIIIK